MNASAIMRPGHPRWREFLTRLDAVPRCSKTTENARAILAGMDGVDVNLSLRVLRGLGGCCDCAIRYDLEEETSQFA